MKFIAQLLFLCLSSIAFYACEEQTTLPGSGDGLTATVNGDTWIAGTSNGAHAPVISKFPDGSIQIEGYLNGSATEKETLLIKIENGFNGVGTYDQEVNAYFYSDYPDDYKMYSSENFTITVAEFDGKKASGTFRGEVYYENEMITITNGVFKDLNIDHF